MLTQWQDLLVLKLPKPRWGHSAELVAFAATHDDEMLLFVKYA
jgi:hypothetical protein